MVTLNALLASAKGRSILDKAVSGWVNSRGVSSPQESEQNVGGLAPMERTREKLEITRLHREQGEGKGSDNGPSLLDPSFPFAQKQLAGKGQKKTTSKVLSGSTTLRFVENLLSVLPTSATSLPC